MIYIIITTYCTVVHPLPSYILWSFFLLLDLSFFVVWLMVASWFFVFLFTFENWWKSRGLSRLNSRDPEIQRSGNSNIGEDPKIWKSGVLKIRKSRNPKIRKSWDPEIWKSRRSRIRRSKIRRSERDVINPSSESRASYWMNEHLLGKAISKDRGDDD